MEDDVEKYVLLDCDPGLDDCLAIMMVLSQSPSVRVVGITCVNGNVSTEQVTLNAIRTVKLCKMIDQVPVFRGCDDPILLTSNRTDSSFYHGKDGLGDVPLVEPPADKSLLDLVQKEHAVNAIIRLSNEYKGKLQILAIGPLTNIAIATRMDRDLPKKVKSLHILGGTCRGGGNITPAAEYNFYTDPESVHITLGSFPPCCPVQIVSYETCVDHSVSTEWLDEILSGESPKKIFFRNVHESRHERIKGLVSKGVLKGHAICDTYLTCIVLDPASIIKSKKVRVGVEVGGNLSRGSLVIDHSPFNPKDVSHMCAGMVEMIEIIDIEKYKQLVVEAVQ